MWEEAGVRVWNVTYHSGQPWVSFRYCIDSLLGFIIFLVSHIQQISWLDSTPGRIQQSLFELIWTTSLLVGTLSFIFGSTPMIVPDARWFTREEVKAVLDHKTGTHFNREENRKMTDYTEGRLNTTQEQKVKLEPAAQALTPAEITSTKAKDIVSDDPPFRLPPTTAIAGVLIRDWVDGKIGFRNEVDAPSLKETIQKGHL